ncbi:MAG TPA: hypothetical protein VGZ32_08760, partial [Actinocrinis sp.]|uniref:hypothetical protein n=1 Tax=Actinocrinis sp. TaxID=1920516 RepID=UPI002DDCCF45
MFSAFRLAAVGATAALMAVAGGAGAALAAQPDRGPTAPGMTIAATLVNNTACTLQLTGGWILEGHLSQDVPLTIGPHSSGAWKIVGWNAFSNADADLLVVFAATGCAQAGDQEGYGMSNTAANGLNYGDGACAVGPAPGLQNTFSATPGYHATLTITLNATSNAARTIRSVVTPDLGQ